MSDIGTDPLIPKNGGTGVSNPNTTSITLSGGSNGYVMTSDNAGNGTWMPSSALGTVKTIIPNSGTSPVVPNTSGQVTMVGSGSVTTVGGTNTLTTQLTGLTNHAVLVGAGTTTITKLGVGTNGQVLIGATGADPSFATLTSTGGTITFTTGANSLNLEAASTGLTWTDVTSATQAMAVQNGYGTDRSGGVVYTLPVTAVFGAEIKVVGKLGLATITPNANQQILMGSNSGTVGATGTAVATNVGDCMTLRCITGGSSTVWRAESWVGSWTLT